MRWLLLIWSGKTHLLRVLIFTSKVPDIDNAQPEEAPNVIILNAVEIFASTPTMEISRKGYNTMTEAFVANGCISMSPGYHEYVVSFKILEFFHQLRSYLPSLSEEAFLEAIYMA